MRRFDSKRRRQATGMSLVALLVAAGAQAGCSSGGRPDNEPADMHLGGHDLSMGGGRDGATDGPRPDGPVTDMAVRPNSWSFYGTNFMGNKPSCIAVMSWWAVLSNSSTPYFCSIDIMFQSRPTKDAVYKVTSKNAMVLGADETQVIITDERTGGVEQWDSIDSGVVRVHVDGTSLQISVESAIVRGAVSVPTGTPDQTVNASFTCS